MGLERGRGSTLAREIDGLDWYGVTGVFGRFFALAIVLVDE